MFGKKNKQKASQPARESRRVEPAARGRRQKIKHVILWGLVGAVIALGLIVGLEGLRRRVLTQKVPAVHKVVLADRPAWLDYSASKEICQAALEAVRENPSDENLAEKVAAKLAGNIWVTRIAPTGIVNNYDGSLTIRGEFRQPLALVSSPKVLVRVDRNALVLPGRFAKTAVRVGQYRQILGVNSEPPEAGQVWNSPDLLAGVELLRLIDDRPFAREITAVDVSNYLGRRNVAKPHIVMTTDKQSFIYWGRAIGTEGRIEVDYQTKLQYLEGLFLRYGSLNNLVYADLRGRIVTGKLRDGKQVSSR